jgi:hypothetical protein
VALPLDERWSAAKRRGAVAEAFATHGTRGTVESLERLVSLYAGVRVRIDEPALRATIWTLGDGAGLGLSTMLAAAQPDGAIVGTTATLDGSHLIDDGERGAPLFEDLAHHFRVELYAADVASPELVDEVRRVIDREKPAHTTYDLCLIEPRMRVGLQGRVGIAALVGGPPPPFVTAGRAALGDVVLGDAVLVGGRRREPIVGRTARVGLPDATM